MFEPGRLLVCNWLKRTMAQGSARWAPPGGWRDPLFCVGGPSQHALVGASAQHFFCGASPKHQRLAKYAPQATQVPPLWVAMATTCVLGLGTCNAQLIDVYSALPKPCQPAGVLGGHGHHPRGWYFRCRKQVAVTSAHQHAPQTHRHHGRPCRRCRPDPSEGANQEMGPCKPKYSATCGPPQLTLLHFSGSMCSLSAGSAGREHGTGGVPVAEFSNKAPS